MPSDPLPLHVTVVSDDTTLLHEVSWVLEAVGCRVHSARDQDEEALWRRYALTDFILFDGRSVAEPSVATFAYESENPVYRIVLYDPEAPTDFAAWFSAGAHDALRIPVSRGELLTRIRTGARYLEFERRLERQSSKSRIPGMYSRRGFVRKLKKLAASDENRTTQHTLLVASIDWYDGIRHRSGRTAGRRLVAAAARAIKRAASESAISAYLGDGCFLTLEVAQTPAAAKTVAENLAKEFGSRESQRETIPRPTLTVAVVPWNCGDGPERLVNLALETLALAKQSGGDCVLQQGEFAREEAAWRQEMSAGNPFANVVAQDIMEPFPALLQRDAEQGELATALRRSGAPVRAFVDAEGRLIGVATDSEPGSDAASSESGPHDFPPITLPESISHDATFPEIYEAFSSRGCSSLVVTADDRPLGYLTCDGFLSMIDPIHAESFSSAEEPADGMSYLLVRSISGEPAPA